MSISKADTVASHQMSQAKKDGCVTAQQERSRRKLDFGAQRFKGKTFYLDLPRYAKVEELKEELIQRGATLEEFFHRDVKYLVTQRNKKKEEGGKSDPSTLSPATPGTTRSVQISPFSWMDSPGSVDSVSGKKLVAYETRAQKMMRMAQEKQKCVGGKMDIVTSAQQWGCKVIPLEALLKELKRLKPLPRKIKGTSTKVRSLRLPFFKVEDRSLMYRPLVYEMTSWPLPLVPPYPTMGPYDCLKPNKGPQSHGEEHHEGKPGYCEPCAVRYQSLCMHLQSVQHKSYAQNPKNFITLDHLISQGTSLASFIDKERKRLLHERHMTAAQQNPYHPASSPYHPVTRSHPAAPEFCQNPPQTAPQTTPHQYYEEMLLDHQAVKGTPTPHLPAYAALQEALPAPTLPPVTTPTVPSLSPQTTPTTSSLQRTMLPSPLQLLTSPMLQATPINAIPTLLATPALTSIVLQTTPTLTQSVKSPTVVLTPPPLLQTTPIFPRSTPPQKSTPTSPDEVPETPEKQPMQWSRGGLSPLVNLGRVFGGWAAPPTRGLGTSPAPPTRGLGTFTAPPTMGLGTSLAPPTRELDTSPALPTRELGTSPALQDVVPVEICRRSPRLIMKKERAWLASDSTHMVSPPPPTHPPVSTSSVSEVHRTSAVP